MWPWGVMWLVLLKEWAVIGDARGWAWRVMSLEWNVRWEERSCLVRVHGPFLIPRIRSHRMRTKPRAHTVIVIPVWFLSLWSIDNDYVVGKNADGKSTNTLNANKVAFVTPHAWQQELFPVPSPAVWGVIVFVLVLVVVYCWLQLLIICASTSSSSSLLCIHHPTFRYNFRKTMWQIRPNWLIGWLFLIPSLFTCILIIQQCQWPCSRCILQVLRVEDSATFLRWMCLWSVDVIH